MATFWYNRGLYRIVHHDMDLTSATLKVLLVTSSYTPNRDHDYVSDGSGTGSATNPAGCELGVQAACTDYTRKTAGSLTITLDDANDRVTVAIPDITWTTLGGAANQTVRGAILFQDLGGADSANPLIAFFDVPGPSGTGILTNGSSFALDFNDSSAGGNLRIASA